MSEQGVRSDKRFQLTVMGGLAVAAIVMIGVVQLFLETSTISTAALLLLALIVLTIVFLVFEL